jgi:hypothetical protein
LRWTPKVKKVKTPIIHPIPTVLFQREDLPVGVVFRLVDVGEGVEEVPVGCIGEEEVDNEEVAEVSEN